MEMTIKTTGTIKRVLSICLNCLTYLFLGVCILTLAITLLSKQDSDGAVTVFGYQMRVVTTDSMAACEETDVSNYAMKSIPARSMIFIQTVPSDPAEAERWYASLAVGDVLTFRYVYTTQVTITHRIVDIEEKADGGYLITLEGDNKNAESDLLQQVIDTSEKNSTNYVIGKVTGQNFLLGFFTSLLQAPVGIVLLIMVPCGVILFLEVIRIWSYFSEERKKKQQAEIDALRRQLADLQAQNASEAEGVQGISEAETERNDEILVKANEKEE